MADSVIEYEELTLNDISYFGDNSNRAEYLKKSFTAGTTSIMRYKAPDNKHAVLGLLQPSAMYEYQFASGAYNNQADGGTVIIRFDGTTKFEHRLQWTSIQGYVGGADDYGDEGRVHIPMMGQEVDASTVIVVRLTGGTARRRIWYIDLIGELDDGTLVKECVRQVVDGTAAYDVTIYTVPAGRYLLMECLDVAMRIMDGLIGKLYLVHNGEPFLAFDYVQGEASGLYNLIFPFMDLNLESGVIGMRLDSFACGDEVVSCAAYVKETYQSVRPIFGGTVISARGDGG